MVSTNQLGIALSAARKRAGLTQDELSDKAGLSYSTLAKIEQGSIKSPSIFTIYQLTQSLGITLDELISGPATPPPKKKTGSGSIKFVYCDVNGVLVRFFQRGFVSMAEETGAKPEVIEATFWHYNEPTNKGEMSIQDFNKAVAHRLGVKSVDWQSHYMEAIEPIVAMRDCLTEISKEYKVGLLTNIMPGFLDVMIQQKLLPKLNYAAVVDSSKVGAVKPEPKMYEEAEKYAGYSGQEILFIDDSRENLTEADKFGWNVLWFDDYRPKESIKRIESVLSV